MPDEKIIDGQQVDGGKGGAQDQQQQNQGQQNQQGQGDGQGDKGKQQDGQQQQQQKPTWPDDWREQLAGEDKGYLKKLSRYASPTEYSKGYRALEQRLSSGELKAQLPKDATEEQLTAWRQESGLPDKPDGYVAALKLPDGVVLGEADKPLVADFAEKVALKGNLSQEQMNSAISWYYQTQDALALKTEDADADFKQKTEDSLRTEWGADYRPNINAVENMLSRMPEGLGESLLAARVSMPTKEDPTRSVPLGNHPLFIKWAAQLEREVNPTATLVPAGTGNVGKTIEDEITSIEKDMRTNREEYFKDEKKQGRYRELIAARDRMKARAA